MIKSFEAKILEVTQEAPIVRTFRLDKNLDFIAGQFVNVTILIDNKEETRPISISSSPKDKYMTITVKEYPDSVFANVLYNSKKDDILKIKGPFGRFIFEDRKNIVLIAGGCGIAPLMSMIKYATYKKLDNKSTLIYSSRTPEDIIFHNKLLELQRQNNNLKLVFTITRPKGTNWNGLTGRINEDMIRKNVDDIITAIFYVSGLPQMVENMVNILKNMGIDDSRIRMERFVRRNRLEERFK